MHGKIKFFNEQKGFGFITIPQERDIFFHKSAIKDALEEGDTVEFETEETPRGKAAKNVRKI